MTAGRQPDRDSRLIIIAIAAIGILFLTWACASVSLLGPWRMVPMPWSGRHLFPFLSMGFMTLLQFAMAIVIGLDARRRGMNGILWGLLVLVTSIVGVIVYLIVASSPPARAWSTTYVAPGAGTTPCPACGSPLQPEYKVCPRCGGAVRSCAGCGRPLERDWKHCPHCGTPAGA